jgi:hypothetical protein
LRAALREIPFQTATIQEAAAIARVALQGEILSWCPIGVEGVITRLMQERSGSRPIASLKEWRTILNELIAGELAKNERLREAVRAEREAILELIESARADYANVYFGDYRLRTVAAAIRARGEKP